MRKENMCISERTLMFAIAGQLFDQAPNRQPRNAEIIMQKARDAFRKDAYNDNEWYSIRIEKIGLYKFIKKLLMDIPEFVDLNLTQIEFEKNVSVDDENRPKYSFTSRYDVETTESWKSDFIDLDAFIRNVYNKLLNLMESEQDCFCCKHEETDNKICKTCIVNPKLEYKFEGRREPKGKYTFACKYDCYKSRYICCEECDDKASCDRMCTGNSRDCGLAINRIYKQQN